MLEDKKSFNILFVGDVFMESITQDYILTDRVSHILREHHIKCCNFEAPVKTEKQKKADILGAALSQPKKSAEVLVEEGFNLFALANNHIMNYGIDGLKVTLQTFKDMNVTTMGAGLSYEKAYKAYVKEINGIRAGFINAGERQFGIAEEYGGCGHAWLLSDYIKTLIFDLKKKCDYIILISHAGAEDVDYPLPEWRNLYKEFINLGVDIVVGHHPHVVQGWESYRNGLIFYSLGNFFWNSDVAESSKAPSIMLSIRLMKGQPIKYKIYTIKNSNGKIDFITDKFFSEHLNAICEHLKNDIIYNKKVDEICCKIYKETYEKTIYELVNLRPPRNFIDKCLNSIFMILGRVKINRKQLYLWLGDETLRWIIIRVLLKNDGRS